MKRIAMAVLAAAAVCASAGAQNAPDFSKIEITTTDLGHNTYMLAGAGGNITLAVGGDGVIMVDSQYAPMHDKIKAAIAAITPQPVRYVVNTHYHADHSSGDAGFAKDGAIIVAHDNVRKRLATPPVNALGAAPPATPPEGLPGKTYADKTTLEVKGRTAQLVHIPLAHTDGDTYVYFADANVLATGDIVSFGRYPFIDVAVGGNIDGIIAGVDIYLKVANDTTKVVPGHGPLGTKADMVAYRAMLATARDRVAKLIKDGKSEDEAVAAKPIADIQAKLGVADQATDNFVHSAYRSLKKA